MLAEVAVSKNARTMRRREENISTHSHNNKYRRNGKSDHFFVFPLRSYTELSTELGVVKRANTARMPGQTPLQKHSLSCADKASALSCNRGRVGA